MELTKKEIFALAKKARERGELSKYLCGEGGYAILGNPDIPANIPTDFSRMIDGIYALYKAAPDENFIDEYVRAVVSLDDTPVHVWCAYHAVFLQILDENGCLKYPPPFTLPDEVRTRVRDNVLKNETALRNCREYLGEDYKDGLWGDIARLDGILAEDYGTCVLR